MACAHVDLSALRANLRLLEKHLGPETLLLAAVKANGYGHGAVAVARALEGAGVHWFGVATPAEALQLREHGVTGRILLLGPAFDRIPELIDADVDLTVTDELSLATLLASDSPKRARVHLKVDTGMGRLGLGPAGASVLGRRLAGEARVEFAGVWTHLASADEAERGPTEVQLDSFDDLLSGLRRDGIEPPLVHACNSAGLLAYPQAHYSLVRPGIALYGYPPSGPLAPLEPGLRPVMTVTARITFVKRVEPGTAISYGGSWRASRRTTIATVRFGYADGYPRILANRGWAEIAGRRVPVAGRVCMDQLMLDVGDAEVRVGDQVTLIGPKGPTAAHLGELAQTVSYEILTSISSRVERVYTE